MENKDILEIVSNNLEQFVKEKNLQYIVKECDRVLLTLCLSDGIDYVYINHSFHPYDFPFEFMVFFGKHELIREKDLKWIGCKPKLPLRWFDKNYDSTMKEENQKRNVIEKGCKGIIDYFCAFKTMSTEEVLIEYKKLCDSAKTNKK